MILRASEMDEENGRRPYPLPGNHSVLEHFVHRVTWPDTPFEPHTHAEDELWYVERGEGILALGDEEHRVGPGDLIVIRPDVRHGLRTETEVVWVCMA